MSTPAPLPVELLERDPPLWRAYLRQGFGSVPFPDGEEFGLRFSDFVPFYEAVVAQTGAGLAEREGCRSVAHGETKALGRALGLFSHVLAGMAADEWGRQASLTPQEREWPGRAVQALVAEPDLRAAFRVHVEKLPERMWPGVRLYLDRADRLG